MKICLEKGFKIINVQISITSCGGYILFWG